MVFIRLQTAGGSLRNTIAQLEGIRAGKAPYPRDQLWQPRSHLFVQYATLISIFELLLLLQEYGEIRQDRVLPQRYHCWHLYGLFSQ